MTAIEKSTGNTISRTNARKLTDSIKATVEMVWDLIAKAYAERAWAALGYASWDEYCDTEFSGTRLRMPREERAEVVSSLRESGLSLRAIEAATGVSRPTIIKDLADAQVVNSLPPEPPGGVTETTPGQTDRVAAALERARQSAADDPEQPAPAPAPAPAPEIVGVDGKKYKKRRAKKKPPVITGLRQEEVMRATARLAELSAWGRASDGLLAALSYAASTVPPEDTGRYPAVEAFFDRYDALGGHIRKWKKPVVIEQDPVIEHQDGDAITLWSPDVTITVTDEIGYDELQPWVISVYRHAADCDCHCWWDYGDKTPEQSQFRRFAMWLAAEDTSSDFDVFGATYLRLDPLFVIANIATWIADETGMDSISCAKKLLAEYEIWEYRLTKEISQSGGESR